jgi:hypothetical protein
MPTHRITLQHLVPPVGLNQIEARDAHFANSRQMSPPPDILLDYMYGAAAYRRWGATDSMGLMQEHFSEYFESVTLPLPSPSSSDDSHGSDMSPGMLQAMDRMNALSMLVKGITPETMAAERERQLEEAELRAQEAGRAKVLEWMQS